MRVPVAFLSGGRLHVKDRDEPPRAFDSHVGQTARDRAVRSAQENAWKPTGAAAGEPAVSRIAVTGVSRAAEPGLLLFALETDDGVDLFTLDPATGEEHPLVRGDARRLRFPSGRPGVDKIVGSVAGADGTAHLALMNADGSDLVELTEGESLDLAPSWVPDHAQVAYQTAGLGRDRQGRRVGTGPFSVQLLDVETAEIKPLLEDAHFDFLGPRVARDGAIYAIRRPYHASRAGSSWRTAALAPVRMVAAVFGARHEGDDPAVAPPSWRLVRKRPGGALEEVACGVLAFDLVEDGVEGGSLVLSDGSAIDQLSPDGTREQLWRGEHIEQVVALGPRARAKARPKSQVPGNLPRA